MPPENTNPIQNSQLPPVSQSAVILSANNQLPTVSYPRNLMAIFSYLSILFWVPIFICKDNPTLKFHIKQGFILFIAEVITGLLAFINFQVWLGIVIFLLMLVWVAFSLIGIKNVIRGKEVYLPIIGRLATKISFPHMRQ